MMTYFCMSSYKENFKESSIHGFTINHKIGLFSTHIGIQKKKNTSRGDSKSLLPLGNKCIYLYRLVYPNK